MHERLSALKSRDVIRVLRRAGFEERHTSGSHVIFKHPMTKKTVSVPIHKGRDIKRGTLFGIIRQAGLTLKTFKALMLAHG